MFPHSTGDEWPTPGSSMRQFTSVSETCVGMVFAWLMPVPFGPWKRVHSWAEAVKVIRTHATDRAKWRSMGWQTGQGRGDFIKAGALDYSNNP